MKRFLIWFLIVLCIMVLISGLVPYRETVHGLSCDYSFSAGHQVCRETTDTWPRNGWLVTLLTGYHTPGTRVYR